MRPIMSLMKLFRWDFNIKKAALPAPAWFVPWENEIKVLQDRCLDVEQNLDRVARQTEATRKKVYRDGDPDPAPPVPAEIEKLMGSPGPSRVVHAGDPPNY